MKINPKQMERAMKQLGIQSEDIDAEEVIIKTAEKEIVILNPQVSKMKAMGQETFQIVGEIHERSKKPYTEDDIKTVASQTGKSEEEAEKALQETNGDLAEAILKLKSE